MIKQGLLAILATLTLAPASHALEVFLTGPAQVTSGSSFDVDFWIDFAGGSILGGGVDLSYDPLLVDYSGFAFNSALSCIPDPNGVCGPNQLDPVFSLAPADDRLGLLSFLTFGNFNGISSTVPLLIGTLSFNALALGLADFGLDPDTLAGWAAGTAPFAGIDPGSILAIGSSTQIVAAVPEPGVLMLLGIGVFLLAGFAKQRTS